MKQLSNILYKLYWRLTVNKWQIGFPQAPLEKIVGGKKFRIEPLKGVPADRWFADPFIVDVTPTHIVLLVEEFLYSSGKGRLARLVVSRKDYVLERNDTLLDLDTHLSFPMIVRKHGSIFICPENSAGGKLKYYEYDISECRCILRGTMCDLPLVDAVFEEFDWREYVFATQKPSPNGRILNIFKRGEDGEFHHCQDVIFKDNIARNGGAFLRIKDRVYRPAQDCNGGYGRGLSIQRVSYCNGHFEFMEDVRMKSPRGFLDYGMHTLNEHNGVTVVDIASYRCPVVGSLVDRLWQWLNWPTSIC